MSRTVIEAPNGVRIIITEKADPRNVRLLREVSSGQGRYQSQLWEG